MDPNQPPSKAAPAPSSVDERILAALQGAGRALTIGELRPLCRVRNATLYERLAALTRAGHLLRTPDGYRLVGGD
jgi:DNA-binding Lrp family transcriptional regulator